MAAALSSDRRQSGGHGAHPPSQAEHPRHSERGEESAPADPDG